MVLIIQIILYLIVFATALPVGLLLAWLCDDELIKDRKYFFMLSYVLILAALAIFIFYFNLIIILALIYMNLVLWLMIRKGRRIEYKSRKKY